MFKRYVSLGQNCEVAFQFRRVLGTDESSFFSWNVTDFNSAIQLIENDFKDILMESNLERHENGGMVKDKKYNYLFHTPFSTPEPCSDPEFALKLNGHRQKANYLINKMRESYSAEWKTAYFYVSSETECRASSVALRDVLLKVHTKPNFTLIVLQDENMIEKSWDEQHLHNHYLKRLAPWHDATDGHVSSYDKIFRLYPHDGNNYYAGY